MGMVTVMQLKRQRLWAPLIFIFRSKGKGSQDLDFGVQLANSSRGINGGAIFSAVSWSKSLPITVLGSCNIRECNSKVFFAQIYFFVIVFVIASTQWGLLTVFAQIDKKWISRQCNSSFLWPFMSALWSVPPKRSKQWWWQCCTK